MASQFSRFQTKCNSCGGTTTKKYAGTHGGMCKECSTGVCGAKKPAKKSQSYDSIARDGGYEDTMGVSPEAMEPYYGGD